MGLDKNEAGERRSTQLDVTGRRDGRLNAQHKGPPMSKELMSTVVAAEFVPDGDPYRPDEDEDPRPAGTYVTVRLDNDDAAVVGGRALLKFLSEQTQG